MSCFRFYVYNFVDIDLLANNDVSSEDIEFPIENAYNRNRRSKVYRTDGYYEVTSANNTIIFRETDGVDLTATIAEAEYTSIETFIAAVETALEAVGASDYTVELDSSTFFKCKITSDGAGGDGRFELMLTDPLFTSADLLGFGTDVDRTGSLNYTADLLRVSSGEWVLWDLGIPSNPTGFILIGPRNDAIKISPNATLKLQANTTDVWTSPEYETTLTYDSEAIIQLSTDGTTGIADKEYRFWRLLLDDKENPNGFVEFGGFFLGDHFITEQGSVQFPLESEIIDRTDTVFSEGGQSFSDILPHTQEWQFDFNFLTKADVEELEEIFEIYQTGLPFYVSMDSNAQFSTTASRRVLFCKFADAPSYELVRPNLFNASITLREEL
jgi:hypothetical protein